MAFGIERNELKSWKVKVSQGEVAFLTHYWMDKRFPNCYTVTKVGCNNVQKLKAWGRKYGLDPAWIDYKNGYPHFDLFGEKQREILMKEQKWSMIKKFNL
ncbi:hypothetical protein ACFFIS_02225 [Virgibacillus soli]|uniref:YneQ n=1 Tax=Paracerasibacillus soli TaxID=480284 RepID=A0ABU5CR19_9BACI|nr:hypothetical protein [Virgibacillus soli]MDY0408237.1 hypothetical protein [Virgibacillus soli]